MSGIAESIPIVDLQQPDGSQRHRADVAAQVSQALEQRGFMYVRGLACWPLVAPAFAMSQQFFSQDIGSRQRSRYADINANFGYQALEVESLDPSSLPDLKETFTMRDAPGLPADDARWPDAAFRAQALGFYQAALDSAYALLEIMALALELPPDFFITRHRGENVTLRYLHYPPNLTRRDERQLGAGAHTDYGSITLLFQDDVGGLEVRGRQGEWIPAPPVPGCAVINTGDLMERWTNGRFRSTPHRVRPVAGARSRYSIALFVDPDTTVEIACLDSCVDPYHPARYPKVTAGEHLYQRIAATHGTG